MNMENTTFVFMVTMHKRNQILMSYMCMIFLLKTSETESNKLYTVNKKMFKPLKDLFLLFFSNVQQQCII